ncbi:hypothetical protein OG705_30090 [Streptomyces sp. NBC_00838]|uniref:hypothetical protein n=1 Tax=Streptomyces sp. NBC_00838 TaxID=2903680 RepID=UPI0038672729|nr:hypothetical protein OG705_30090 [Streptomyces sp. NBC_00838]
MAVYFIYSHDGAAIRDMADLEYAPNLDVGRRELASRVSTGHGTTSLVSAMTTCNSNTFYRHRTEDEWPAATSGACLYVWRRTAAQRPPVASDRPNEIWTYSGNADKPHVNKTAPSAGGHQ